MTSVRPWRLITRQRSHIGLTEGRTFMGVKPWRSGAVSIGDPAAGQVVRRQLDLDLVPGEDADVVLAHLPGDGRENVVATVQLHAEHRARKGFGDLALHLDLLFLARHPLLLSASPRYESWTQKSTADRRR